ncbi:IS200/IS605 family transposase [Mannheimia varigena]|uniref:IS200/IS605 family transposase n=1 Tax=Mannheimia varigena TaxID=85404 RepID=UPI000DBF2A93|nr:IS200/IS605 family transposase [Mannheimia varigena]AWW33985.1 IS200/IS605 family transposase [Mannheimia varigena]QLB17481.1 transposase [Mannheimia varigena]
MSYTRLIYHIIFRTKHGVYAINEAHEALLYRYIWGFVRDHNSILHRINGMPDHLHLLVEIHQSISVAEFVGKLKRTSHLFLDKHKDLFPDFSEWSVGYCALSYCERDKQKIVNYIKKQKEHHKTHTFKYEIKMLLAETGIEINNEFFDKHI